MKIFILDKPFNKCYHVESDNKQIYEIIKSGREEFIPDQNFLENHIEIGPRRTFKTSWNSNMCQILNSAGFEIDTIEYTTFYPKDYGNYDKMLYEEYKEDVLVKEPCKTFYVDDLEDFNKEHKLGFDQQDIDFYLELFKSLYRNPTNVELYDLSQCNSEHARHWFFKGKFIKNDKIKVEPNLMDMLKTTKKNTHNSLISFYDNASVIEGNEQPTYLIKENHLNLIQKESIHYSYKAETHNFPTGIAPFPGAATGVGGRMRDNICVGLGGSLIAGTAGYCVGDIDEEYDYQINSPRRILIEASNGASDYGNKVGEPLIQGFTRSYKKEFREGRKEWLKPIMFSGGIGKILDKNLQKKESVPQDLIVRIGGPAYNIGMGGGSASSRSQDNINIEDDLKAVQRGDPEMANKVVRFVKKCCELEENPIISIHDQGSGGMANVTREIAEPNGAKIFLDKLELGDKSMNSLEKWVSEYQEQITILIKAEKRKIVEAIAESEKVPINIVGFIDDEHCIEVISDDEDHPVVSLPTLESNYQKIFRIQKVKEKLHLDKGRFRTNSIQENLEKVFYHLSVCSKSFLVHKVDRSVGGLVVQQQTIGPYQLALSNYSMAKNSFYSHTALVSAIGEKPIIGIYDIESMIDMTISEMLCNMIWGNIDDLGKINSVANWMWSSTEPDEAYKLRKAVKYLVDRANKMGFSINGGKDSLSMNVKVGKNKVKGPNNMVLSGYTTTNNYKQRITPNLKSRNSYLLLLKINHKTRLGGSIIQDVLNLAPNLQCPKIDNWNKLRNILLSVQELILKELILSGHDRSDGGLMTTLTEMCISSGIGIEILGSNDYLFNEEMGLVIEVEKKNIGKVKNILKIKNVLYDILGFTTQSDNIVVRNGNKTLFNQRINYMRYVWSKRSLELEKDQTNLDCIQQEKNEILYGRGLKYHINDSIYERLENFDYNNFERIKKVAILREEGSNGDSEMGAAFYQVGFDVYNLSMNDLITGEFNLDDFCGIAFVGGFSYSDVLGAGNGWNIVIQNNKNLKEQFDNFYKRYDTFSLGVCNGCQVMSRMGYVGNNKLIDNKSGKFESRFNLVKIEKNNSIFLDNLEGMVMGIWSSHGEGQFNNFDEECEYPIRYVNHEFKNTESYPSNPNGSINGICGFSSKCGRHLAMMPHPERCFLNYQVPYIERGDKLESLKYSPWILMFRNAFVWSTTNSFV